MREITILSGKGGTGKTSLTAAFSRYADRPVLCDLDVDASDLQFLVPPQETETQPFVAGQEASLDPKACIDCGICEEKCRFDAVRVENGKYSIIDAFCEGCGVCAHFCPTNAITMSPCTAGLQHRSLTAFGPMFHAHMYPGAENSGTLVAELRKAAKELAVSEGYGLVLSEGPPGIGCPAISALTGTTLAVIVTEPTPSGRHDLERIADLCNRFKRPAAVVINKADLAPDWTDDIAQFCDKRGYPLIARIPFCLEIPKALANGRCMADIDTNGIAETLRGAWTTIETIATTINSSENERIPL